MEELLFDFSLDTYKPSAMNSSLLCFEALEVVKEIENGTIKKPNLDHVLKELSVSVSKDEVAKSILSLELSQINSVLLDPKKKIEEKKVVIELVKRQLQIPIYKKLNEKLLIEAITDKQDFSRVRSLTRSYVTLLLNIGYDASYLNKISLKFFYFDKNRIAGNVAIKDFLKLIASENKEFEVIFKGASLFSEISIACKSFDIEIKNDLSSYPNSVKERKFPLNQNEVYVCAKGVKARDSNSARKKAEKTIDLVSTLFSIFHHKDAPKVKHDCLVIDPSGWVGGAAKPLNNMHKCVDHKPMQASKKMNTMISEFSLERHSFQRFTRSAELHSLALNSDSTENQMINLWIALESVVPSYRDENSSNIEVVVNGVVPFLNLIYHQRLISRLVKDLINWDRSLLYRLTRDVQGDGLTQKLIKIMALPKYEERRKDFLDSFSNFYLLRDRFSFFCEVFSGPKEVITALDIHTKRLEWQIRRIYRARNLIVHSGITQSFTKTLIENLHDYLDVVMGTLIRLATKPEKIMSIDQGFKYVELLYSSYVKALKAKNAVLDEKFIEEYYARHLIRLS